MASYWKEAASNEGSVNASWSMWQKIRMTKRMRAVAGNGGGTVNIYGEAGACNNERLIIKLRSNLKRLSVSLLQSSSHYNFVPTYYSLSRDVESPIITTKVGLLKTNFSKADKSYFPGHPSVWSLKSSFHTKSSRNSGKWLVMICGFSSEYEAGSVKKTVIISLMVH